MVEIKRTTWTPRGKNQTPDNSQSGADQSEEVSNSPLVMQRGVSQLLFHYLPGRTVDWENGLAIVQLTHVQFASAWEDRQTSTLLDEIALLFERWRRRGGSLDPVFPDPRTQKGQFAVGTPTAIQAAVLETALLCQNCSRLHFLKPAQLAQMSAGGLTCNDCQKGVLRQLGQVFVHGCGELVAINQWMPASRETTDGFFEPTSHPLACQNCGTEGRLALPSRSERARDMSLACRKCGTLVRERFTANCKRCLERLLKERRAGNSPDAPQHEGNTKGVSPVARIAMRMSRYSASQAYYPQTLTMLRLDRPTITQSGFPDLELLRGMLPAARRPDAQGQTGNLIQELGRRLKEAEARNDDAEKSRITAQIMQALRNPQQPTATVSDNRFVPAASDLERAVGEAIAFRETVTTQPAVEVARQNGGVAAVLIPQIEQTMRQLGLQEVRTVADLPVICATYGYTRRSFEPTYDELSAKGLPAEIRAFPSLDRDTARRLNRADLQGAIPVLAREGEHEGLFFSLDPDRIVRWLENNNIRIGMNNAPSIVRLMGALEEVDRFYDDIWQCPVRRFVFGLVHSLSHAAMRAASRFAGLERTSLSEYVFLPLLGAVVFDNSSTFKLGGLETLARDHLLSFLRVLAEEAMTCLYDAQCIDHYGACHGCLHSPEISCRVFNHGLSRAFLMGGHAPWADVTTDENIIGYWQM
jgi:hypothetical protein